MYASFSGLTAAADRSAGRHHFAKMRQKSDKMTINKQWNIAHDIEDDHTYGMQCEIESVMLLCLRNMCWSWSHESAKKKVISTLSDEQQPIKLEISSNTVIWLVDTEFLGKMLRGFLWQLIGFILNIFFISLKTIFYS